ncbi:MAG: hypothetical protein ACFE9Z_16345 [Promethearchaeota archaeon]
MGEKNLKEKSGKTKLRDYIAAKKFIRGIKGGPQWTELANEIHKIGRKYGILIDYELRKIDEKGLPKQCDCNCDCCCTEIV